MNCTNCGRKLPGGIYFSDCEYCCCDECAKQYDKKVNYFMNTIIYDNKLFDRWLAFEDFPR